MTKEFFGIFDDNFFPLGFAKPRSIVFNTNGLQDMNPAKWTKTEDGYVGCFKTLGCENIEISVEDYGIKLVGSGEVFDKKYNTTLELPIGKDVLDNIVEILHSTKAGITRVEIILNKPEKRQIKINGKIVE